MDLRVSAPPFGNLLPASSFAPSSVASGYTAALGLKQLIRSNSVPSSAAGARVVPDGLRVQIGGAAAPAEAPQRNDSDRRLAALARDLCAPFQAAEGYALELGDIQTRIAELGSPERAAARCLVQCAYGSRYLGASAAGIEDLDDDTLERSGDATTVVAVAQHRGRPQVIGALRFIVGARLCMFDFFAPQAGSRWPHGAAVPAEYTRLAFHPIFDQTSTADSQLERDLVRLYRLLVLRKLVSRCTVESARAGAGMRYFIAAPHVVRFLLTCGLRLEPLPGAVPVESEFARSVRQAFPRYWRDGRSGQQPAVFLLDAELAPVSVGLGANRVTIRSDNSMRLSRPNAIEPALATQ